mmetsp:Transcript_4780/g.13672  ORF Transcript_4780/g.13672 Transcript_4780/m.13672 type:complete len:208 (+) Transcript_4780:953-1576(+)
MMASSRGKSLTLCFVHQPTARTAPCASVARVWRTSSSSSACSTGTATDTFRKRTSSTCLASSGPRSPLLWFQARSPGSTLTMMAVATLPSLWLTGVCSRRSASRRSRTIKCQPCTSSTAAPRCLERAARPRTSMVRTGSPLSSTALQMRSLLSSTVPMPATLPLWLAPHRRRSEWRHNKNGTGRRLKGMPCADHSIFEPARMRAKRQ